ncbi:hypothetical protein ACFYNO_37220 [Kitasatospora sp. NPDC006697]|uniref:hypothetical protein n=1 Tax=Kitasatospora sp. NPDC006697 TaxID=3364020 RepID=UPI00368AECD7
MRIRSLALATAAVAAAAIGIAPAASATTTGGTPFSLTIGTATATGTAQYIDTGSSSRDMLVTGTITNTGSGCYEILPTNYLGGFFLTSYNGGGICGPGTFTINYRLKGTFQGYVYMCEATTVSNTTGTADCTQNWVGPVTVN